MKHSTLTTLVATALLAIAPLSSAAGNADDAIQRLVHSHDPAIFVATGALYLKQEAIRAAGGKALAPALNAEVDRIIDRDIRDAAWFYAGLAKSISPRLSAEEADEIATHFATDTGQLQRHVMELSVGEVLSNIYTFTGRIDHQITSTTRELTDLQQAVGPLRGTCACLTPKERADLARVGDVDELIAKADLSNNPEAVQFANSALGVKYMKLMMLQGIESMTSHFESVAKKVRELMASQTTSR